MQETPGPARRHFVDSACVKMSMPPVCHVYYSLCGCIAIHLHVLLYTFFTGVFDGMIFVYSAIGLFTLRFSCLSVCLLVMVSASARHELNNYRYDLEMRE